MNLSKKKVTGELSWDNMLEINFDIFTLKKIKRSLVLCLIFFKANLLKIYYSILSPQLNSPITGRRCWLVDF